jgi:hypothetical protein
MELPRYCIVGLRPVKLIETEEGGMDCLAYDWDTGAFVRNMDYLTRASLPDSEVDVVTADAFDEAVAKLRMERGRGGD